MVAQKSRPSLCRFGISRSFSHPAQDGSLRNVEAQHLQLTVNAWRTPGGVLGDHAEDEFAQFSAYALSSRPVPMPREPRPIQLESRLMPANDGLRLDENQGPLPSWPNPPQDYPKQFVGSSEPRLRAPLIQNSKLLAKSQIFQQQITTKSDRLKEQDEDPKSVGAPAQVCDDAKAARASPSPAPEAER